MTAIEIEDMYELSPMQRGMLFHTLYAPHSGVYIDQLIYQIDGQLEPALLHKAWQQVIWRHAPLRTAFLWEELDNPLQVVYRDLSLPWEQHDWRDLSPSAQHDRLEALLAADRQRGFDLIKPPLMHLKLLRLSNERHYLVWCHHHLLLDGWSAAIILQEVFLIYRSLQTGETPDLAQRLPFRDYITWLQQQDSRSVETFWRTYLQGVSSPTPLLIEPPGKYEEAPLALTASKAESLQEARLRGGRPVRLHGFHLSDEQLSALRLFTRQHQLTLNTVIQGAWALLLSRYSGERDIIFGATVAGRPMQLSGAERMIGLFINTLPVRVQLPPRAKIVPWLKHLQEQQAEAHQYDSSPLVQVQGCSEIPRDQSLFESLLVFENYPLENQQRTSRPSRLRVRFVQSLEQTNYPLVLVVTPGEQALHIDIGYETARFSEAAIMQMLKHFSTLLTAITRSPDMRLEDISLLNAEEKRQLLTTWNEMGNALHEQKTPALSLIEAFQCSVAQASDHIALVCGHHHLTYEELDRRSNQLAHELILLGVTRESAVGVCLERSPELPIALLSIFKANGIYLPLNPNYPSQRLAQMLAEAQVAVVLTRSPHLPLFKDCDVKALCLEHANAMFTTGKAGASRAEASPAGGDRAGASSAPTANPLPAQAAYIMYTSGSTGGAKGVVVPHYALLNHIQAISAVYSLNEQDRVLQFASANFDVALEELLPSWIRGACVVMITETPAPSALTHLVDRESLSVINLPSSYWHEWVADLARSRTFPGSSLRLAIIGSEQASAARLNAWQRLVGKRITLCNAYGLTETTITSLTAIPEPIVTQNEKRPLPVGRPLANIQAYVLDERLQPVPVGMPGELYIGGLGLARGYLGNPMLTAERFIPHPSSTQPGARLYRSGDRARYLPSGEFEVLGRSDAQIKIRGFRIEPGEIEARLLQHPAVHEALVLVYEENLEIPPANAAGRDQSRPYEAQAGGKEASGDPQLAAYVVVREQEPSLMNRLRHFLQEALPPYMVPTFLIPLETLPRTATGKIDRRAFPTPQQKLMLAGDYIAPLTPVEEIVAGIWSEVLHLERTSRTDHFFKLGGHSLQATQVVARLREIMRIELPVRAVYDSPTVAALAARIEQERQRSHEIALLPLQPVSRDTPLPLSFAQQRLWFLDQLQPESPFYNIAVAFHARGTPNVCALEASVHELLHRHEILRTTFTLDGEQPVQVIAPMLSLPLPIIQLGTERDEPGCSLGEDERRVLIARLCNEEARRPFDLGTGPLIRVSILRLSRQEHVLLLTLHHIVADGWSVDIFLRELSVLYRGRVQGQPVTLPPLAIQYADYAVWQRCWLQGEILERQLAYWRQQLDAAPTLLELPMDRPRPAIQTYNGACHTFLLPLALVQRLRLLSRGEGVTLFMALLAGIQALLFRYTGQTDIVVGTPAGGRIQRETEGLIGLFLNTLVLRTRISGDLTYRRLLECVRNVALEAYMHQDLPFEKLVDEMHIERSLHHTPLFQVLLTLQQATVSPVDLYGLHLESLLSTTATAKFDLSFELFETSSGLYGLLTYNTDLFDGTTIERMVGHLQTLLEDCVARPDAALIELNLLTRAEQQLLVEWNTLPSPDIQEGQGGNGQPVAPWLPDSLWEIVGVAPTFEAQVERTPDAVALVWEQEQLTYQELNARANQLAHHLRLSGIASEIRVGIYLERSIELVIAVLGVLKAGGAYLPLDLDYPRERLAFMLQDAQVPILLTQEHLLDALPAVDSIICLKRDWTSIARQSWQNPVVGTQIQNTAYIIYTSGSTGKPKGVMVSHANITRLFKTSETIFHFTEHDICTLFHSTAFDFSVWELWGALLYGGRLVVVPYWVSRSPEAFSALLCQQAVTVLNQTPSAFRQLIQFEGGQTTEQSFSLRLVVFGGEALDFASLQPWFDRHGDQAPRLINMYGITETTVHVTYFAVTQTNLTAGSMIGRPLADLQMYVLDTRLRPVPIGVPGEMYVGGAGLARGYLNRPELTAERFIPHPFGQLPGARLYRTGDLARFRPDGSLEYLGRIDQQVKLHGFRIELEEIERTLRQHPAVKDALVGLQSVNGQQNQDQQHLVAYVVMAPQHEVASSSELRSYLQTYLPNYMLPALFIPLEALPLSPNGKIDRKRLPVPDQQQRPELDASFVAPGTEIECLLATIWAEVLGLERVGVHDRFFELGGDSIQVIQVTARARKAHLHLTPRQMFQHQTIAELVTVIQAPPTFILEQGEVKGSVPLTPIQRWFFAQNQPGNSARQRCWTRSIGSLRSSGGRQGKPEMHYYNQALFLETERLPISLLAKALNYLLCYHDALRMRFAQEQDGWQQQNASIDEVGPVPFLHIDCVGLPPLAQRKVIAQTSSELQAGLHLEKGPLLRAAAFDLGTTQRLLLIAHHLIIDGVSWSILLEDLNTAYQQLSHGEEIHLPPKTSSFQRWAQSLLAYVNSPTLKQEATYWLTSSRTPIAMLPVDRSSFQEAVTEASAQRVVGRLSQEETRALLQEVPKAYHTQINDVLLAALAETLRAWTNGQAFLVDLEGHGREHILPDIDLSRTVGWFTTIFPVLLNLVDRDTPGEVLVTVKEQLRSTPNHGIGYGLLRYLQPDPAITAQLLALPQAELSFNYLGQIDRTSQEPTFFRPASEPIGPNFSPQTRRTYKLDILASISAGQLQAAWIYSEQLYERTTIEYLAQQYIKALRRLIDHCLSPDAGGYTPSDFPAAQIDTRTLSKVAQMLEEDEEL